MASHHCHGVRATVIESGTDAVLDLQTGRRAGVSPASCAYGVFPYTIAADLADPLSDRAVTTTAESAPPVSDFSELDSYLGRHVEDGVEWALANDRPWRVARLDGEAVDDGGPVNPERLSFTVVADVIVSYEWS
jgi:hypothetical protein